MAHSYQLITNLYMSNKPKHKKIIHSSIEEVGQAYSHRRHRRNKPKDLTSRKKQLLEKIREEEILNNIKVEQF